MCLSMQVSKAGDVRPAWLAGLLAPSVFGKAGRGGSSLRSPCVPLLPSLPPMGLGELRLQQVWVAASLPPNHLEVGGRTDEEGGRRSGPPTAPAILPEPGSRPHPCQVVPV